jgi:hypothetical protein
MAQGETFFEVCGRFLSTHERPAKERPVVLSWKNTIRICQLLHSTIAWKTA